MQAETVDQVLDALGDIIADTRARGDKAGFFAALYRQVTAQVQHGIETGFFQDGPRMARLDVVFANRYLAAYAARRAGAPTSKSWKVAFSHLDDPDLIILQHLLLGINAHINLDLGIAAAQIAPGAAIEDLAEDFARINTILSALIDPVEAAVGRFSPLISLLDRVGGRGEEELIGFSMRLTREEAWAAARLLAHQPPALQPLTESLLDGKVALLGKATARPPRLLRLGLHVIREVESDDVPAVIDALAAVVPPAPA